MQEKKVANTQIYQPGLQVDFVIAGKIPLAPVLTPKNSSCPKKNLL
jgi:hypothetical protein